MKKLLLLLPLFASFSASAEVQATVTLGDPVAGVPVDEVLLWCHPVGDTSTPVSLLDMSNLTHTFVGLPDGPTECLAQAVSNVNSFEQARFSNKTPSTIFEVKDGSAVGVPNTPRINILISISVGG